MGDKKDRILNEQDVLNRAFDKANDRLKTDAAREITISPGAGVVYVYGSSSVALAANASRRYASFINNSDSDISLAMGTTAAAGKWTILSARGGAYEINALNLYTGTINCIHGVTGSKALAVNEGV